VHGVFHAVLKFKWIFPGISASLQSDAFNF